MTTTTDFIPTDWLDMIDGMFVKHAIEYLESLDPMARLNAYMDGGDTWGVELCSNLMIERQLTPEEVRARALDRATKDLNIYISALVRHETTLKVEVAHKRDNNVAYLHRHIATCKERIAHFSNIVRELT